MKKRVCLMVLSVLMLIGCIAGSVISADSNILFDFNTLNAEGTLGTSGLIGKDKTNPATYSDGILKMSTTASENLFLTDAKIPENVDQFTISVEFTVSEYTTSTILEAVILLGESRWTNNHHRFEIKDKERTTTSDRTAYFRYQRRKVSEYLEKTTEEGTGAVFNAGEWVRVDLLVDETNKKVEVYVNKTLVKTVTDIKTDQLPLDGRIGFRGKGVSWRNLVVYNELVNPAATQAPTETPTQAPTETPTQAPTEAPTQAPTQAPTEAPTQAPTEAPTQAPTEAPTEAPSVNPETGDNFSAFPLIAAFLIITAIIVCISYKKQKNVA